MTAANLTETKTYALRKRPMLFFLVGLFLIAVAISIAWALIYFDVDFSEHSTGTVGRGSFMQNFDPETQRYIIFASCAFAFGFGLFSIRRGIFGIRNQRYIKLTPTEVILPKSTVSTEPCPIHYADITSLKLFKAAGIRTYTIKSKTQKKKALTAADFASKAEAADFWDTLKARSGQ